MDAKLNLPLWKYSKVSSRVMAAKARALKVSSDIVKNIPINFDSNGIDSDAKELEILVNKMLSSGTIKSLEEVYEITGVSNPNPTKSENEQSLNRTGCTVVNGSTFLKLNDSENVEAIRMLYNAGLTLDDIRSRLSVLKEGDTIVLKCGKILKKFPKQEYLELLDNYSTFRGYKEYITTLDSNTYAICDTPKGNLSTFILYVEQGSNSTPYLSCNACLFPIVGTLTLNSNNVDYDFSLSANSDTDLLIQLNSIDSPFKFSYNNGLVIKCDKEFKVKRSDVAESLNIKKALIKLKESIQLGYSGGEIISEIDFYKTPYNILVKKPSNSRSNSLSIYKQLVKNGVDSAICDSFLNGNSLYESIENRSNALRDAIGNNSSKELVQSYSNDLYKSVNVRILGTSLDVINKLLNMSDSDLEYLLRYRFDIVGIDPYTSEEEVRDSLIKRTQTSTGGSYFYVSSTPSDNWKQNTANVRTVEIYEELAFSSKDEFIKKNWLNTAYEFLDGVIYFYNKDIIKNEGTYYTNNTLGLGMATTVDWSNSFSFARGLEAFTNIRSEIPDGFIKEFEEDMLIIQNYLYAAFSAFSGVCGKLGSLIHIINSSLGINANLGSSFGFNLGSLLQCSLSFDLKLNIPIYIPQLNNLALKLVDKLEALVGGIADIEKALLCPIQGLLDKYLNTNSFALPCKISYKVPTISGLDAYIQGYIDALNGLKIMCNVTKRDSDWVKYETSLIPGSVNLLVANSESCQES